MERLTIGESSLSLGEVSRDNVIIAFLSFSLIQIFFPLRYMNCLENWVSLNAVTSAHHQAYIAAYLSHSAAGMNFMKKPG